MPEIQSAVLVKTSAAEIRARLSALKEDLIARALAKGVGKSREELVVRDIDPEVDFGKSNKVWSHTFSSPTTWENYTTAYEIGDKVIGIIGLRNDAADPKTVGAKFGLGSPVTTVRGAFLFQSEYLEPEVAVLFSKDIVYEKGEKATIMLYGRSAGADGPIFLGLTVEKKGVTVSPE